MPQYRDYQLKPDNSINVVLKRKSSVAPTSNITLERKVERDHFLEITLLTQRTGSLNGILLQNDDVIPNTIELPFDCYDELSRKPLVLNSSTKRVCSTSDNNEMHVERLRSRSPDQRSRSPLHKYRSSESRVSKYSFESSTGSQSRRILRVDLPTSSERSSSRHLNRSPQRSSERRSERTPPRTFERNSSKSKHSSSSSDRRRHGYDDFERQNCKHRVSPERRRESTPPPPIDYYDLPVRSHHVAPPPEMVRYPHIPYQTNYYPAPPHGPTAVVPTRIYREPATHELPVYNRKFNKK